MCFFIPIPPSLLCYIYFLANLIVLAFVGIALPLPLFVRHTSLIKRCYTFWGLQDRCPSATYISKASVAAFSCNQRAALFHCGGAFAVLALCASLCLCVYGALLLPCWEKLGQRVPVIAALVCAIADLLFLVIAFAAPLGAYCNGVCSGALSLRAQGYGRSSAFGLLVSAAVMEALNVVQLSFSAWQQGERRRQQRQQEGQQQALEQQRLQDEQQWQQQQQQQQYGKQQPPQWQQQQPPQQQQQWQQQPPQQQWQQQPPQQQYYWDK